MVLINKLIPKSGKERCWQDMVASFESDTKSAARRLRKHRQTWQQQQHVPFSLLDSAAFS